MKAHGYTAVTMQVGEGGGQIEHVQQAFLHVFTNWSARLVEIECRKGAPSQQNDVTG